MNTGNQFGMGRSYFNMLKYDDSNGPKMNSFIDRNESRQIKVEIDEYIGFNNIVPLEIITIKNFNGENYVLLEFEHFVTKNKLRGFFKSSLFMNYYPKMLIDYYESNLEDNY